MNWGFSNEDYEDDDRIETDGYLDDRRDFNVSESEEEEDDDHSYEDGDENHEPNVTEKIGPYLNKRLQQEADGLREYRQKFKSVEDKKREKEYKAFIKGGTEDVAFAKRCVTWTTNILKSAEVPFIPSHCHVVAESMIYNDTVIKNKETARYKFLAKDFLSHDAYCQGVMLPYKKVAGGNLKNVYFVSLIFKYIKNDLPVPVSIKLGHRTNGKTTDLENAKIKYKGESHHAIVPPGEHHNLPIYFSTKTVNDAFGAKYPSYTIDNVGADIKDSIDRKAIPKRSPCAWWYFKNKNALGWPTPDFSQSHESYIVTESQAEQCIKGVKEIINSKLQIVDLNTIFMNMTPLYTSNYQKTKFEEHERHQEIVQKATGLSFILQSRHIFRDTEDQTDVKDPKADILETFAKEAQDEISSNLNLTVEPHLQGMPTW